MLIDCQAYRQSGHSPSDGSSYRSRDELEMWRAVDPIDEYARSLETAGLIEVGEREAVDSWARDGSKKPSFSQRTPNTRLLPP